MIDVSVINRNVDLLQLTSQYSQLTWAASTGGGEYKGPCPFCPDKGEDRFRVQPNQKPHGIWMCRHCTAGKWQDPVEFARRIWQGLTFSQICERLAGDNLPLNPQHASKVIRNAYQPPSADWQKSANQAMGICHKNLLSAMGEEARIYLAQRGLQEKTMQSFHLGFSQGAQIGSLYIPRGIVIPCMVKSEIWYLKIALLPGQPVKCEGCGCQVLARESCPHCGKINKYRGVRGNRPAAIFNADWLGGAEYALFCEGEFDAMIAHQELNNVLPCVTLGSAGNRLDLAAWGSCLAPLRYILVAYDNDHSGKAGAAVLEKMTNRVHSMTLPSGIKDINEWYLSGGNLWMWVQPVLDQLNPLPPDMFSYACQLAGVVREAEGFSVNES